MAVSSKQLRSCSSHTLRAASSAGLAPLSRALASFSKLLRLAAKPALSRCMSYAMVNVHRASLSEQHLIAFEKTFQTNLDVPQVVVMLLLYSSQQQWWRCLQQQQQRQQQQQQQRRQQLLISLRVGGMPA